MSPTVAPVNTRQPRIADPQVNPQGIDRPHIALAVQQYADAADKLRAMIYGVAHAQPPGIVYVATRRHAVELAAELIASSQRLGFYHGGMSHVEREKTQRAFEAGEIDVIVITDEFRQGMSKDDVRFVYHFDISDSLDSYYEEIGQAGRDGRPAEAVLFYRSADLGLRRFFASGAQVNADDIRRVMEAIRAARSPVKPRDLQGVPELSPAKRQAALDGLEAAGAIEVLVNGEVTLRQVDRDIAETARQAVQSRADRYRHELSRIEIMQAYAETTGCRRKHLLNYFGEHFDAPCANCDNCLRPPPPPSQALEGDETLDFRPFPEKSFVIHRQWGKGMVVRYDRHKIVILFDEIGHKTFQLPALMQAGLLRPAP